MARLSDKVPENVDGPFFVDSSCIDCDTCRQLAPAVYGGLPSGQSFVQRQPATGEEIRRAAMAVVACPTASIGSSLKEPVRAAATAFPERLEGDVYYCGYVSADSYGASSYLVVRPEGNVLVDSPRFARPLVGNLEKLGGVRWMFLTHRDDVADHAKFAAHFGCERVLHAGDVGQGTTSVERTVAGAAPLALAPDLTLIPVPGHTAGSMALLFRDELLFTGDHLWWEDGGLHASRGVCWFDWGEQKRSVARLLDYRFRAVLPGHGRRHFADSAEAMRGELERLVARLR